MLLTCAPDARAAVGLALAEIGHMGPLERPAEIANALRELACATQPNIAGLHPRSETEPTKFPTT